MAAAFASLGGFAQMASTAITPIVTVETPPKAKPERRREGKEYIISDYSGGLDIGSLSPYMDYGNSPKEYGQYLQNRGLQVWSKRKRSTKRIWT